MTNTVANPLAQHLRDVAADAQLVGYKSPAQEALLLGAAEIDRLQALLLRILGLVANPVPLMVPADEPSYRWTCHCGEVNATPYSCGKCGATKNYQCPPSPPI
jgi:hypothetical protein